MIILFYSNQCQFSEKLLEYIKKNNLEKYFKMINIDEDIKIPDNITIVPTIIDDTIEGMASEQAIHYLHYFILASLASYILCS